jgi:hypothetical protein
LIVAWPSFALDLPLDVVDSTFEEEEAVADAVFLDFLGDSAASEELDFLLDSLVGLFASFDMV